jgi:hypothetical protein
MRTLGAVLLAVGLFGFIHASDQLEKVPPLAGELSWREALDEPAGRWQTARYGCVLAGGLGLLLAMFPKGR